MDERPRYMISVAADLVGMHPQTLRIYETKGLLRPKRTAGNTRLYSEADLERLRLIQRLTNELGLNLAGVEQVLRLEDELRRMHRRLDRMEREMRAGDQRGAPAVQARARPLEATERSDPNEELNGFQQADSQEPGGRRGCAGACAPDGQPGALSRASAARAARPGAAAAARPRCGRAARAGGGDACAASPRCRACSSSRTSRPRSRACSTAPPTRRAGWRTTTSRPSTCCSRSTSSRATSSRRRSRPCAAGSASRRRIPRRRTRRSRSSGAT